MRVPRYYRADMVVVPQLGARDHDARIGTNGGALEQLFERQVIPHKRTGFAVALTDVANHATRQPFDSG
jgi:hypothetical protein